MSPDNRYSTRRLLVLVAITGTVRVLYCSLLRPRSTGNTRQTVWVSLSVYRTVLVSSLATSEREVATSTCTVLVRVLIYLLSLPEQTPGLACGPRPARGRLPYGTVGLPISAAKWQAEGTCLGGTRHLNGTSSATAYCRSLSGEWEFADGGDWEPPLPPLLGGSPDPGSSAPPVCQAKDHQGLIGNQTHT